MPKKHTIDKIFCCFTDNKTFNIRCMELLYDKPTFNFILGGRCLRIPCCAHIINLYFQLGIKTLSELLDPIRDIVKLVRLGQVKRRYKQLYDHHGLKKLYLSLDTPTRWDLTHDLLKRFITYGVVITQLDSECTDKGISNAPWELAIGVHKILEAYDHAIKIFSYVYEPNVHLVISEKITILYQLVNHSHNDINGFLKPILEDMMEKWNKYFYDFPYVYGIETILDPSLKTENITKLISFYYHSLVVHRVMYIIILETVKCFEQSLMINIRVCRDIFRCASVLVQATRFNPIITKIIR